MRIRILIGTIAIAALMCPAPSSAAVMTGHGATTFEKAKRIQSDATSTLFGQLPDTGTGNYFTLTVDEPTMLKLSLGVSPTAPKFVPQVVMFHPSEQTIGPTLPIAQPPQTYAYVYPARETLVSRDMVTSRQYIERLNVEADLPSAGTYVLAVYNAGTEGGRYRLDVEPADASVAWSIAEPVQLWWLGHHWLGIPVQALTALFLVLAGLLWIWYRQRIVLQSRIRRA